MFDDADWQGMQQLLDGLEEDDDSDDEGDGDEGGNQEP